MNHVFIEVTPPEKDDGVFTLYVEERLTEEIAIPLNVREGYVIDGEVNWLVTLGDLNNKVNECFNSLSNQITKAILNDIFTDDNRPVPLSRLLLNIQEIEENEDGG